MRTLALALALLLIALAAVPQQPTPYFDLALCTTDTECEALDPELADADDADRLALVIESI